MEEMYVHKVQYYETDKMGVVHHSNYIRWFEEARIDYLEKIGIPYKMVEDMGFIGPVLSVKCEYKKPAVFGDTILVDTKLVELGNVRFRIKYEIMDSETKEIRAIGETTHCFLDSSGKVVSIKKKAPEVYERLLSYLVK